MTISWVNFGTRNSFSGVNTRTNGSMPTGFQAGDWLLSFIHIKNTETITPSNNTGWTTLGQWNGTSQTTMILWKISDGTETTGPTYSWTTNAAGHTLMHAVRPTAGATPNSPSVRNTSSGTTSTHSITGKDATRANALFMYFDQADANTALAQPTGWVERRDGGSATSADRDSAGDKTVASAGVSCGDISVTGANANWQMQLIEFTETTTFSQSASGGITPSGIAGKQDNKPISGAMTPAGTAVKQTNKTVSGALSSIAGAISKQTNKVASGALSSIAGTLSRQVNKVVAGALSSIVGALDAVKQAGGTVYEQVVGGTLTSAGTLIKQASKAFAGVLSSTGALSRITNKILVGTLTSDGAAAKQTNKSASGAVTSSGGITRTTNKLLSGTVTLSGAVSRQINKVVSGVLSTSGAITKAIGKFVSGVLSAAGELIGQLTGDQEGTATLRDFTIYAAALRDYAPYTAALRDFTIYAATITDREST